MYSNFLQVKNGKMSQKMSLLKSMIFLSDTQVSVSSLQRRINRGIELVTRVSISHKHSLFIVAATVLARTLNDTSLQLIEDKSFFFVQFCKQDLYPFIQSILFRLVYMFEYTLPHYANMFFFYCRDSVENISITWAN